MGAADIPIPRSECRERYLARGKCSRCGLREIRRKRLMAVPGPCGCCALFCGPCRSNGPRGRGWKTALSGDDWIAGYYEGHFDVVERGMAYGFAGCCGCNFCGCQGTPDGIERARRRRIEHEASVGPDGEVEFVVLFPPDQIPPPVRRTWSMLPGWPAGERQPTHMVFMPGEGGVVEWRYTPVYRQWHALASLRRLLAAGPPKSGVDEEMRK